jgi:hypothetical protein
MIQQGQKGAALDQGPPRLGIGMIAHNAEAGPVVLLDRSDLTQRLKLGTWLQYNTITTLLPGSHKEERGQQVPTEIPPLLHPSTIHTTSRLLRCLLLHSTDKSRLLLL